MFSTRSLPILALALFASLAHSYSAPDGKTSSIYKTTTVPPSISVILSGATSASSHAASITTAFSTATSPTVAPSNTIPLTITSSTPTSSRNLQTVRTACNSKTTSIDAWHKVLQESFPPNEQICKQATLDPQKAVVDGNASALIEYFFTDRNGSMANWTQLMYNNVTSDTCKTPKVFLCYDIYQENCNADGLGECEDYNPAAFVTIERQIVNLWSTLKTLDFTAYKSALKENLKMEEIVHELFPSNLDTRKLKFSVAAYKLFIGAAIVSLLGIFLPLAPIVTSFIVIGTETATLLALSSIGGAAAANVAAIGLLFRGAAEKEPVDFNHLQDSVNDVVLEWLERTESWAQNITGRLFGGENPGEVDLWQFVDKVVPAKDNKPYAKGPDWQVLMHMFRDGAFLGPAASKKYVDGIMDYALQVMRLAVIREIYKAMEIIAVKFKRFDKHDCQEQYGDDAAFVDGYCWVLWQLPEKKGSPFRAGKLPEKGLLNKTIHKYDVNPEFMFRNILACNNNQAEMNKTYEGLNYTDKRIGECVFPIYFVEVCDEQFWGDGNVTVAQEIGFSLGGGVDTCKGWS